MACELTTSWNLFSTCLATIIPYFLYFELRFGFCFRLVIRFFLFALTNLIYSSVYNSTPA